MKKQILISFSAQRRQRVALCKIRQKIIKTKFTLTFNVPRFVYLIFHRHHPMNRNHNFVGLKFFNYKSRTYMKVDNKRY